MKKTKDLSDEDEYSADDPEEVEDAAGSEEEWNNEAGAEESATKKRPQRATAGKKRTHSDEEENEDEDDEFEDEEEEEEEDEEEEESDSDSGRKPKRKRRSVRSEPTDEEEDEEDSDDEIDESGEPPKDFTSGAFVIAKSDMANGDSDPTLWRIDGKALLQKYLPVKEDGKTLYKSTSTYSGWSAANKDNYYAAQVTFKVQGKEETVVELSQPINKEPEETNAEVVKEAKED